jgi:hypothetical protein
MYKKLIIYLLIFAFFVSLPHVPVNASVKNGENCSKLGKTSTALGKVFICTKSGKKLIWKDSKTFPISEKELVSNYLQKLSNQYKSASKGETLEYEFITENSKDQQLTEFVQVYVDKSYAVLNSWAKIDKIDKVVILIYRSQKWLEDNSREYCLKDWSIKEFSNANLGICKTNPRKNMIIISPSAIAQDKWEFQSDDIQIDINKLSVGQRSRLANVGPHEFFHTWQYNLFGRNWPTLPSWFVEGFAEVFANLIRANIRIDGSYKSAYSDWRTEQDIEWSKSFCKESVSKITYDMKFQCQYSKGMLAAEFFLYKFDGFKTLNALGLNLKVKEFNEAFKEATKMSIEDFYEQADKYLITLGWKIEK